MSEKHRILIIDDTAEDRDIYRKYLCQDRECVYTFAEADNGQAGLEALLAESFGVVLLDYNLPDFSGLDFLEKLRALRGDDHPPIVMITGRGDERIAVRALRLGAYDYVVKSDLSSESLFRATRNAIEKRQQELKIAEEQEKLRVSQEHLELLVEGARDHAMILLDKTGRISQWNKGAKALTGYSSIEALGQPISLLFEERDRRKGIPEEELERAKRGGRHDVERWLVRKDGQRFWATGSVCLLYAANGSIRGYAKIVKDGTQKRYSDEEKINEGKWLENLLDFLPVAFALIEPRTGRVRFANRAAHQLFGGQFPIADSIEDYQKVYKFCDESGGMIPTEKLPSVRAARGERVSGMEMVLETAQGPKTFLFDSVLIAPLYGRDAAVALAFQDISQLKQSELELKAAKVQAEHSNQAKGYFLANMSHEIRTPLGAIMGYADLLVRRGSSEEERKRFGATIKRNGQALIQIIDDILDFSKIEAGKFKFDPSEVDLRVLIADAVDVFAQRAADRGIQLRASINEGVPDTILADSARIRQILLNMLSNAMKFTEQGSITLNVKLGHPGAPGLKNSLELHVVDSGIGITADQQEKLFRPFAQADGSTARKFGGTGLGLVLSRRLAEGMHGQFDLVESALGRGSHFALTLPLPILDASPGLTAASPAPALRPATGALAGRRILVIDDTDDHRVLAAHMLDDEGATVETARNGLEGLELAGKFPFDAIVTDIQMPAMDGYETARRLRAGGFLGAIISLTAHAFRDEQGKSAGAGFDDHLVKPIDAADLVNCIVLHLQRHRKIARAGIMQESHTH